VGMWTGDMQLEIPYTAGLIMNLRAAEEAGNFLPDWDKSATRKCSHWCKTNNAERRMQNG